MGTTSIHRQHRHPHPLTQKYPMFPLLPPLRLKPKRITKKKRNGVSFATKRPPLKKVPTVMLGLPKRTRTSLALTMAPLEEQNKGRRRGTGKRNKTPLQQHPRTTVWRSVPSASALLFVFVRTGCIPPVWKSTAAPNANDGEWWRPN